MMKQGIARLALAVLAVLCVSSAAPAQRATAAQSLRALPELTAPRQGDGLTRALQSGRIGEAQAALLRAQALFAPATVERRYGPVAAPGPRDATMILRDLALRLRHLPGRDRTRALALLARPTDSQAVAGTESWRTPEAAGSPSCSAHVCVHWTATGPNAPAATDADTNGVPDWVDLTRDETENTVWANEVTAMGYRAPMDDTTSPTNGGDGRLDVYISNIGTSGIYGYCTTDDPNLSDPTYRFWNFSAYCVVENDYLEPGFGGPAKQVANLRVTLAHEFFHAVQFAYDAGEDAWLMEGTAVWMEDQVYDSINDNRQYLVDSQLRRPSAPLDRGSGCCTQYGAWIFWRYLTERLGDPSYIRSVWQRADGSSTGPDDYSLRAAARALAARGLTFRAAYGDFAVANRIPALRYEEGAAYRGPSPAASFTLSPARRSTGAVTETLNHLTSVYIALKPGKGTSPNGHLTVAVDAPPLGWGPEARIMVFTAGGDVRTKAFALDAAGKGKLRVSFGVGTVNRVVLVMSNASGRFTCWRSTTFSCQGKPADDRRPYAFRASLS
jgi:hypothetical protein